MDYQIAQTADIQRIANFISRFNAKAEDQSLHCGSNAEKIVAELKQYYADDEAWFLMAIEGGELIGLLGGDCDVERERLWIWGPYAELARWEYIVQQLYEKSIELWSGKKEFTAYLNIANERAKSFFEKGGYTKTEVNHNFVLKSLDKPIIENAVTDYSTDLKPELERFHNIFFPNTYFSVDELHDRSDKSISIHFIQEGDQTAGYIVGEKQATQEGYIHFLGILDEHRRKGLAGQLVQHLCHRFLKDQELKQVHLTVKDSNEAAKKLYFKLGFSNEVSGLGMIKKF